MYEKLLDTECLEGEVVPRPMAYKDVSTAADMFLSLKGDPLEDYIYAEPDKKRHKFTATLSMYIQWWRSVYFKTGFTISDGQAFVIRSLAPVEAEKNRTRMDKLVDAVTTQIDKTARRLNSNERQKRWREVGTVLSKGVQESLGEELREMLGLAGLGTHPEYRNRGYASTLVRMVTALADEQGRATWLTSSNRVNLGFYNSLGFHTVDTFWVGKENFNWKGKPIPLDLMVREPHSHSEMAA